VEGVRHYMVGCLCVVTVVVLVIVMLLVSLGAFIGQPWLRQWMCQLPPRHEAWRLDLH
jgi:uncharacterized protein YybS (DUF2232 family)